MYTCDFISTGMRWQRCVF